eukprot:764249-Hanusia_phi.AAC.1
MQNAALHREIDALNEKLQAIQEVDSLARDIRLCVDSFQHLVQDLLTEKERSRQLELQCKALQNELASDKVQWVQGQKQRLLEDELESWKDLAGDFESMRYSPLPRPSSPFARSHRSRDDRSLSPSSRSAFANGDVTTAHASSPTRGLIGTFPHVSEETSGRGGSKLCTQLKSELGSEEKKDPLKAEKIPTAADLLRSRKQCSNKQ